MNRNIVKTTAALALGLGSLFFTGCLKSGKIESISETELFSIPYGSFEEQLTISSLNQIGQLNLGICMRDGFFYIVNDESKKIMELNSYGDLLTLFYNEDSDTAAFLEKSKRPGLSVHRELSYPFDYPGQIAVNSSKCIYTVCSIPRDRQEQSDDGTMLYSQTVLRFTRDGGSVDYIGQQGPGGTPFPNIKNIYTTSKDELVVVCNSTEGLIVYWFASDGFLKYMIPVTTGSIPGINGTDDNSQVFLTIENVVPDTDSYRLFVKVDYYSTYFDEESKVQSGVNYVQTLLYTLDTDTALYTDPVVIPHYEESVVADYSRLTYKIPYDFLGVTKNGWKFFIIKTEDGFNIEMVQSETQKILRRHFTVNHNNILFDSMNLSQDGIITALYVEKEKARVVWYRTDNLIESIVKN